MTTEGFVEELQQTIDQLEAENKRLRQILAHTPIDSYQEKDYSIQEPQQALMDYLEHVQVQRHQFKLPEKKSKTESLRLLLANIAHEMRTPLAAIKLNLQWIMKVLCQLMQSADPKQHQAIQQILITAKCDDLKQLSTDLLAQIDTCYHVMDIQVKNMSARDICRDTFSYCSVALLIKQALATYPMNMQQRARIACFLGDDFNFWGDPILTKHMFWNLLKNALYAIRLAGNGDISIDLKCGERVNKVYFKDTGTGISASVINNIFNEFYTERRHTSGLGLSFCRLLMRAYGGDIQCVSQEGEFTEFVLSFPKGNRSPD